MRHAPCIPLRVHTLRVSSLRLQPLAVSASAHPPPTEPATHPTARPAPRIPPTRTRRTPPSPIAFERCPRGLDFNGILVHTFEKRIGKMHTHRLRRIRPPRPRVPGRPFLRSRRVSVFAPSCVISMSSHAPLNAIKNLVKTPKKQNSDLGLRATKIPGKIPGKIVPSILSLSLESRFGFGRGGKGGRMRSGFARGTCDLKFEFLND